MLQLGLGTDMSSSKDVEQKLRNVPWHNSINTITYYSLGHLAQHQDWIPSVFRDFPAGKFGGQPYFDVSQTKENQKPKNVTLR